MGIRLYPVTENPVVLEKLAGVPAGTHALLEAMREKYKLLRIALSPSQRYELEEQEYQELDENAALGTLDHFLTFGWGRVNMNVLIAANPANEGEYSGRETDTIKVGGILLGHGIAIPGSVSASELEGLRWS